METINDTRLEFTSPQDGVLTIFLSDKWDLQDALPKPGQLKQHIDSNTSLKTVVFDSTKLTSWDTSLLIFVSRLTRLCSSHGIKLNTSNLPDGVCRLLKLAETTIPASDERDHKQHNGFLAEIGDTALKIYHGLPESLNFIGEIIFSLGRLIRGKAQFRPLDLYRVVQQVGPNALPIVSLVSFLVGLILAYMGAAQLERVGVQIYIADLVGIGMVREIGALMTGIIMAGRTGASFAAELGTMQVNEEIDAFKTLGISIIDFLVLPRILALVMMIPLLTLYSGLMGILAGMFIGMTVFDITFFEYYQQTIRAIELKQFGVGLFKGSIYGIVIAISGCLRGLQCGRSALAVGEATTSAVVTSIVYIVITASVMTIVLYKLGI